MSDSKRTRATIEKYSNGDIPITLEPESRVHDGKQIPFVRIRIESPNGKTYNFSPLHNDVTLSQPIKTDYDKFDKRTMFMTIPTSSPNAKTFASFYQNLTNNVNRHLDNSTRKALALAKDYVIPNPCQLKEADEYLPERYSVYCNIHLNNVPDKDFGAFNAELIDGTPVPATKLDVKNLGIVGSVTNLSYEVKGKKDTMHIAVNLYKAIVVDLIKHVSGGGTDDVRADLAKIHGFSTAANAKRLLDGDDEEDAAKQKAVTNMRMQKRLLDGDDEAVTNMRMQKRLFDGVDDTVTNMRMQLEITGDEDEPTEKTVPVKSGKMSGFSAKSALEQ